MNANTVRQQRILLDLKKNRIFIPRKTLNEIGNPTYILLLVKPEERTLVISHGDSEDKRAHRIPTLNLEENRCRKVELYSKSLIASIVSMSGGFLLDNSSYKIQGDVIPDENILRFHIDKAESISKQRNKR